RPVGGVGEPQRLGCLAVGSLGARSWRGEVGAADFFALKGTLEGVAERLGVALGFEVAGEPFLHPRPSAGGSGARAGARGGGGGSRARGGGWGGAGGAPPPARGGGASPGGGASDPAGAPLSPPPPAGGELSAARPPSPPVRQDIAVVVPATVPAAEVRAA